jgi:DNA polymerase-1
MIKQLGVTNSKYPTCSIEEIKKYFADKEWGQLDTETTGTDPHTHKIISLQLGDSENQFFIDARKYDIRQLKEWLESRKWILQNAKFDYKMLKKLGIILENIYDTMIAEAVLYCGYRNWGFGLDDLVKRYCDVELSKDVRGSFIGMQEQDFSDIQIKYGCLDVTHLEDIKEKQRWRIEDLDLQYCIDLEMKAIMALGDMEYNGVLLDEKQWLSIADRAEKEHDKIMIELDGIVSNEPKLAKYKRQYLQQDIFGGVQRGITINYGSPIQIKAIIESLGTKLESTEERELEKLKKKYPFVAKLMELRKIDKQISTYGRNFLEYINPSTGRIHTDFWQVLNTGRLSSNDPNMQNLPAKNEFRNAFVSRPGFKWVSIDYNGQELRLMADKSGEKGFIDVLNRGEDLHCYAGSLMFKKTITKADKEERTKAKTINFGKPYGMGPSKLADTLSIPLKEAEELFKMYAKTFPTLNKWLENQGKFAKRNGYSLTFSPCKRRRFYPEMEEARELRRTVKYGDKDTWRKILIAEGGVERDGGNSPIQGAGADICKEALIGVRELIKKYNTFYGEEVAFLILTVHDAIDAECREDIAEQFAKEMGEIMVNVGNKYVEKVKMEVDITITNMWTK